MNESTFMQMYMPWIVSKKVFDSDSLRLIEEELDDVVPAFGVVEEHKEGPVDEPGPLLEWLKRRAHRLRGKRTLEIRFYEMLHQIMFSVSYIYSDM